ncbi:MAG: MBL fold metallo-hydrolase [Chloroflexota bacterium]|nr:MBL fold metallo-hydrolase [Chloroflexota bacterium]
MGRSGPGALALEVIEVPNGGFMSDQPTNATIVGTHEVFIVDPGDSAGVEVIQKALGRRDNVRVKAILLTHSHPDHATAVPELKRIYDCPVMLNPKEQPILRQFLDWTDVDAELTGGMTLRIEGGELQAVDTPGHSPGHVALYEPTSRTLIAGDLVSGNGTVGIFPPHGKMVEYLASLERARQLHPDVVIPGHGPTIYQPPDIFAQYIAHRLMREGEVYTVVAREPTTIEAMIPELYPIVLPHFRRAAAATILAHLEKLRAEGKVRPESDDLVEGIWSASASSH